MNVQLTLKSGNAKTGPIPVSTTSNDTCPDVCPLKNGGGCYAEYGNVLLHWRKVNVGERGTNWAEFCSKIAALPDGQLWRHNQAGDLPGINNSIDMDAMHQLMAANMGKRGFTFTHKPMLGDNSANRNIVAASNLLGFTINLSGNNIAHADELKALDIAPVVCILPQDAPHKQVTPAGNIVIVCPAQTHDDVTCENCQLCARATRPTIIGFLAHGIGAKKVINIAVAH